MSDCRTNLNMLQLPAVGVRRIRSGYKVIFVPLEDTKPTGMPVDVLTGLLVADDVGYTVWRVSAAAAAAP